MTNVGKRKDQGNNGTPGSPYHTFFSAAVSRILHLNNTAVPEDEPQYG